MMKMNKALRDRLEEVMIAVENNGGQVNEDRLEQIVMNAGTTMTSLFKYCEVETSTPENFKEYTLTEVLDLLNRCAGDDLYDTCWNFKEINGKIYDTWTEKLFRIKGFKA